MCECQEVSCGYPTVKHSRDSGKQMRRTWRRAEERLFLISTDQCLLKLIELVTSPVAGIKGGTEK